MKSSACEKTLRYWKGRKNATKSPNEGALNAIQVKD
jgi:hypothetical protein